MYIGMMRSFTDFHINHTILYETLARSLNLVFWLHSFLYIEYIKKEYRATATLSTEKKVFTILAHLGTFVLCSKTFGISLFLCPLIHGKLQLPLF